MSRRRVTLAEVAREAGVSSPTASLVLSGRGTEMRISAPVQTRVREVAQRLGYRTNVVSIGLRSGTSRTLGFVSDTVATSQLAGDLIRGALEAAHERGYLLFIGETEGDPSIERPLLEAMLDRQVDGLILASMSTRVLEVPTGLEQVPMVLLNALPAERGDGLSVVVPDEREAGQRAAQLLVDAGHRRIHLIGAGPTAADVSPGTVAGAERLAGVLEVLAGRGLAPASGHVIDEWLPPAGRRAAKAMLAAHGAGQAVITFNDRLAFGAYQAAQEAGLSIPRDLSIVSFDDHPLAGWLRPGLTTFEIPHAKLGRAAVEAVLDLVTAGPGGAPRETRTQVRRLRLPLHRRGSVARIG